MKLKPFLLPLCIALFTVDALGCQFHEVSDSKIPLFPPLSPALHPVMLQHFSPPETAPIEVALSASSGRSSSESVLTLRYRVHPDYHNVKAEIVSGRGVEIKGRSSLYLTRLTGDKTLTLTAPKNGKAYVRVRVSAVRHGLPVIVEKRIAVLAG
ncbi:hypothetical protein [Aestuariibacter sp. A3R04]|uniref:hypothetical protein n=1 Tax=Aestuariibacter sp. A3R04 TaxID=2841571 RepID=UPI001C08643F|nr:hypothetical protein [Aestuariibacter sp. A3R04]MBU3021703.1 hypothetical protein [Aestuariibacter sp. A3R04]